MNRLKLESSSRHSIPSTNPLSSSFNLGDPLPLPYKIINNPKRHNRNRSIYNDKDNSFKIKTDNEKIRRIYALHKQPLDGNTESYDEEDDDGGQEGEKGSIQDEVEDDTTAVDSRRVNNHILKTRNFKSYPIRIPKSRSQLQSQRQSSAGSAGSYILSDNVLRDNGTDDIYDNDNDNENAILNLQELVRSVDDEDQLRIIKNEFDELINQRQIQLERQLQLQQREEETLAQQKQQEKNIFEELERLQQAEVQHKTFSSLSKFNQTPNHRFPISIIVIAVSVTVPILTFLLTSYLLSDLNYDYCYFFC
ncbi:uncharacterized protein RJT21DRAFT_50353 [Scheffersomyces amazonensis]|uniref:uncharacterized protein n=1 Tax=Scheffersomyces amazonensis TaxID=1078765 RepID=UPI00315CE19A